MKTFKQMLAENTLRFSGTIYHGSGSEFDRFEQSKARIPNDFYGGGVAYFTDNMGVAETYAKSMARKSKGDPIIYTVSLKLKKIFDVDHKFTGKDLIGILPKDLDTFARGAGLMTLHADKYAVLGNLSTGKITLSGDQVFKGLSKGMTSTAVAREHLISKGYDGLRYNGGLNMGMATRHNVYLAYNAKDITILKRQVVQPVIAEEMLDETSLLGPKGSIHKTASMDQSDREYLHQTSFKNKWKLANPGKKWPGYEKAGYKHPSYKYP